MKYTITGSVVRIVGSGFGAEARLEIDGNLVTEIESVETRPTEDEAQDLKAGLMEILMAKASEIIYERYYSAGARAGTCLAGVGTSSGQPRAGAARRDIPLVGGCGGGRQSSKRGVVRRGIGRRR